MCGQKKISCLFHIETIELDNFHRKDNMLIFFKLVLDLDVLFEVKVIISKRDWLWLSTCCFVGLHHLLSTKSLLLKLIISLKNVINQENNLWRLCERSDTSDRHIERKQIFREGSTYTRGVCCRWGQSNAQVLNLEVSSCFSSILMTDGQVVINQKWTRDSQIRSNSSSPKRFHVLAELQMLKMLHKAFKK